MGWEIYEERMVVRDGKVAEEDSGVHYALVTDGYGTLKISNQGSDPETLRFYIYLPSEDDTAEVTLTSFNDAVGALRRLRGVDVPLPKFEDVRERAAVVVERACHMLQGGGDVGQTAADDLRATMLQLIDLATSRGESTPELQSGG
jgi:hypothetical protein